MLLSVSRGGYSLGDRVPQKKKRERKAGIELDFSPNSFLFPLRLFPGSPTPPQEARLFFLRSSSPINCSRRCHTAPVSRPTHPPPPSIRLTFLLSPSFLDPGAKKSLKCPFISPFPSHLSPSGHLFLLFLFFVPYLWPYFFFRLSFPIVFSPFCAQGDRRSVAKCPTCKRKDKERKLPGSQGEGGWRLAHFSFHFPDHFYHHHLLQEGAGRRRRLRANEITGETSSKEEREG